MLKALIISSVFNLISAYNIAYYDCGDPTELRTYQLNGSCKHAQWNNGQKTETFSILQKRERQQMRGFSCRVRRSTITEYCGSFSHNKLAEAPRLEVNYPISPMTCLEMAESHSFTTPNGKRMDIGINTEYVLHVEDLGTINIDNGQVKCQGQSKRFENGQIVDEILQVSQFRIQVEEELFIVDKGRIEVVDEHIRLPRKCALKTHGCVTGDKAYAWLPPEDKCSLEKVRTVEMTEMDGFLVDTNHKILLKRGHSVTSPTECPDDQTIFATEYDNIFITADSSDQWPTVKDDLDVIDFITARDDYIVFFVEGLMTQQQQQITDKLCHTSMTQKHNEIIQVKDDEFVRRNGDVIEHFHCKRKVNSIADDATSCYVDIPLENGGFVKSYNRLFTDHSAKIPCNSHFGLKIQTEENIWIELNPIARKIDEPSTLPSNILEYKHEDMSDGGLYTPTELEAWKQHLAMPDYHEAISKSISYGVCVHDGDCTSDDIQPYDLGVIIPLQTIIANNWNIWTVLDEHIKACGTYLSLIVITLELMRLLSIMTVMSLTFAKDGKEGAKAVLYILLCRSQHIANSVSRRHRRLRMKTLNEDVDESDVVLEGHSPARNMGPDVI